MKKILLVLLSLTLFITVIGCSDAGLDKDIAINENIRKEIAEDSFEIIEMVKEKVNEGKNVDASKLAVYESKYYDEGRIHFNNDEVTWEEHSLIMETLMIANPHFIDDFMGVGEHNDKDFEKYERSWYRTLRTGK